jgi:hypothetical protein
MADTATLLRLAAQLRRAATDADRPDVVARVDDLVVLIAGDDAPTSRDGKAASVLKFLDGLGF